MRIKTGLYDNLGKAESSIQKTSATGNPTWTGSHTGNRIAFVGDFEFELIYRLTDHWSTQFGYQLLWLEGLTLADRQTQFGTILAGSPEFDTGGGAWFNGITREFDFTGNPGAFPLPVFAQTPPRPQFLPSLGGPIHPHDDCQGAIGTVGIPTVPGGVASITRVRHNGMREWVDDFQRHDSRRTRALNRPTPPRRVSELSVRLRGVAPTP